MKVLQCAVYTRKSTVQGGDKTSHWSAGIVLSGAA
jgi:hypothetical protein